MRPLLEKYRIFRAGVSLKKGGLGLGTAGTRSARRSSRDHQHSPIMEREPNHTALGRRK